MIYTIHRRPDKVDSLEAIPERVSYTGLLFAPFWLLWHRLWLSLFLYIFLLSLAFALTTTPYSSLGIWLLIFASLYLFLEGSELRRRGLYRRGFIMSDVVDASDSESAILKSIYRH